MELISRRTNQRIRPFEAFSSLPSSNQWLEVIRRGGIHSNITVLGAEDEPREYRRPFGVDDTVRRDVPMIQVRGIRMRWPRYFGK